tara:strand:- start:445 stop:639 length:195 start_codon:yes stop_codon:yes gene_type:complete
MKQTRPIDSAWVLVVRDSRAVVHQVFTAAGSPQSTKATQPFWRKAVKRAIVYGLSAVYGIQIQL